MKETKVDLDFVNFVNTKKNKSSKNKKDSFSEDYDDFLNIKRNDCPFNNLNPNNKIKENQETIHTLSDFLNKNKDKVINEKKRSIKDETKIKINIESYQSNSENSEEDNDSDYSQEKINHFLNHKKEDFDINEFEETLKEMNERSQLNKRNQNLNEEDEEEDCKEEEEDDNKIEELDIDEDRDKMKENIKNKNKNKIKEKEKDIKENNKKLNKKDKKNKNKNVNVSNTVFIGNLDKDIKEEDIRNKLQKYGDIKTIRLIATKKVGAKNFCYVDFDTEKGMKTAIENKLNINNINYSIEKARSSFFNLNKENEFLNEPTSEKRLGKKKKRALLNKAKEEMKIKKKKHNKN